VKNRDHLYSLVKPCIILAKMRLKSMGYKTKVIAIDILSGLDCDLGKPRGITVKASHTITIIELKLGFVEDSTIEYVRNVTVVDICCPKVLLKKYALSNS